MCHTCIQTARHFPGHSLRRRPPSDVTGVESILSSSSLTSGFHPQSNSQAERANQDLETALRCMASHLPSTRATHLPWVEYAHNSTVSSATGMSPFMINSGYQPPCFPHRRLRRQYHQSEPSFTRSGEYGEKHGLHLEDCRAKPAVGRPSPSPSSQL